MDDMCGPKGEGKFTFVSPVLYICSSKVLVSDTDHPPTRTATHVVGGTAVGTVVAPPGPDKPTTWLLNTICLFVCCRWPFDLFSHGRSSIHRLCMRESEKLRGKRLCCRLFHPSNMFNRPAPGTYVRQYSPYFTPRNSFNRPAPVFRLCPAPTAAFSLLYAA